MILPTNPKIVALLPMKAHSSRVPGKNFRDLCGKPLYRWILDTLLEIHEINQVVINTDARDLLDINGLVGSSRIVVRDRNPLICGDDVSMNLILADDLAAVPADIYLMTHTTNPLISEESIRNAIDIFKQALSEDTHDSLFSVNRFQSRFYQINAKPLNHDPTNLIPTQNLEPWFEENSCFYLFTAQSFVSTNARIGTNPQLLEIPRYEAFDIDEQMDWDLVESILNASFHADT